MVSDRFLTRWMRALVVLASAIAVFVAAGDEALAARSKKKAAKRPAAKSKPHAQPKAPPPAAPVEPAPAADPVAAPAPVEPAPQPAAAAPGASAAAEPATAKKTVVIIIEGTNARELDKALRNAIVSSVNVAAPGLVAESVTLSEQQTFDRPKNKREVVKAARKVAKRAKVDGVIYANVGGSTSKGYSAATLLVYKNGKVGADASIPVAKTTRKGKRQVLHWNYAQVIAAVQPGLESFPAETQEAAPDQQSLGDAMAQFDAERGDEPVIIDAGDVVATAPVDTDTLYYRRVHAPIHLKIGIEGGHRSFSYNQPITSNLRDYSVGFVPLIHLEGEAFPFGNTDVAVLKNIGWYGMYERAIGVESSFQTSEDNVRVSNTWASWQVGIHSRFNVLDSLTIGPQLTYGYFGYRFNFDNLADLRSLEVPDVRYNFLRIGLEARAPLFMFDIAGGLGYNDVLSGGRVASQYFPNSSTAGVDAYLTLGYPLTKHIAIDGSLRYNRWFYSMNPARGDTYIAGGAVDQYFMASLNFVYMFGTHNDQ